MEDDEGPNHNADNAWDITGTWDLQCQSMATNFGQTSPYTLQIFLELRRAGKEAHGRFDLGEFKGVFRFSTRRKPVGYYPYQISRNDADEFILDADDETSEENPTRCYRWRGKDMGENIIQLRSDNHLYMIPSPMAVPRSRANGAQMIVTQAMSNSKGLRYKMRAYMILAEFSMNGRITTRRPTIKQIETVGDVGEFLLLSATFSTCIYGTIKEVSLDQDDAL